MDAINLILFAVLFVLQVAILILLLRRRSGDAGHQTELLARQLQAQDNERRAQIERLEAAGQPGRLRRRDRAEGEAAGAGPEPKRQPNPAVGCLYGRDAKEQ